MNVRDATTVRYQVVALILIVSPVIYQIIAQPTVTLFPGVNQTICRGEIVSYNCIGNGIRMEWYSPPMVNESGALTILSRDTVQTSFIQPNAAALIVLNEFIGNSPLAGTFILYISQDASDGEFSVHCRVSTEEGLTVADKSTFLVSGPPSPATNLECRLVQTEHEGKAQVLVNVSWDSPQNAQEFMLQINNGEINNYTIRSLENSVTVWLLYGTYSATLCAINRCGETCLDSNMSILKPPLEATRNTGHANIVAATFAGVFGGGFFIFLLAYSVIATLWILRLKKKNKLNNKAISTSGEHTDLKKEATSTLGENRTELCF